MPWSLDAVCSGPRVVQPTDEGNLIALILMRGRHYREAQHCQGADGQNKQVHSAGTLMECRKGLTRKQFLVS